jgi:glycosyltransferase involved in cell wall biosynthesis
VGGCVQDSDSGNSCAGLTLRKLDTVVLAPAGYLMDPDIGSDYERPWRLAKGLAARGFRVVVVAREVRKLDELGPLVELDRPPGRAPRSSIGRTIDRVNLYFHARRVAYREVTSGRAFIVHHLGPCGDGSPSLIGQLRVPFVYGPVPASRPADVQSDDEWQSWLRAPDPGSASLRFSQIVVTGARPLAQSLRRRAIQRADAVTVEADTETLNANVVVIRPGIDVDQFKPLNGGQPTAGRIVAGGRFLGRKGYDVLVRAVSRVVRIRPATHLILVGSGPQEQSLRLLASQLGIDAAVTFKGEVSRLDLIGLLQSAEVFCHPARWDSYFPAGPLEAMACGLPMMVSAAGALPELVGGSAGMVHPVGDDEELASQLLEVLTNSKLRVSLGTAARARVVDHFTWQAMCDAYVDLYTRLAARKGSQVSH